MRFYFTKVPSIFQELFPHITWKRKKSLSREISLTFDDGPCVDSTPFLLKELSLRNAQATFFVTGHNAEKHPALIDRIRDEGHSIGNHGYEHHDPLGQSLTRFMDNVNRGIDITDSHLFRPPFGRLRPNQLKWVLMDNQLVMWSLMPGDFDRKRRISRVLNTMTHGCAPGDIIVLHDHKKSLDKLKIVLPRALDYLEERGYQFRSL